MMREIPDLFRAQTYERSRILGTRSGDGSFFLGLPSGNFAMVCDGVGENPSNSFIKSHLKLDPGMDATPMDVRSSR